MLLIYRKCIYVYCHLKKTYIYVCMYISIHIHVQRDIFYTVLSCIIWGNKHIY